MGTDLAHPEPVEPRKAPPESPLLYRAPVGTDGPGTDETIDNHGETGPGKPGREIILVVDDNAEMRDYIRTPLED